MPIGAEPTGLTFTPDYKYGFFSVQHPSGSNATQLDATGFEISFNASAALVFSNEKFLGQQQVLDVDFPKNTLVDIAKVYPNPTSGVVTVAVNEVAGELIIIQVYDIVGRKVTEITDLSNGMDQKISVNLTPYDGNQLFVLQVQVGHKKGAFKVMKSN